MGSIFLTDFDVQSPDDVKILKKKDNALTLEEYNEVLSYLKRFLNKSKSIPKKNVRLELDNLFTKIINQVKSSIALTKYKIEKHGNYNDLETNYLDNWGRQNCLIGPCDNGWWETDD